MTPLAAQDVSVSDRTMMGCRIDLMVTRKDDQLKPNYLHMASRTTRYY